MKQIRLNYLFITLATAIIFTSCHKDKQLTNSDTPTSVQRAGIYILNQGEYQSNNSTLTFYSYTSKVITPDIYSSANADSTLGDVGNDVGIYGSKMYIIVNNSNKVDVVNAKTAKLIKSVSLFQCRSVVFYKNDAFITSYNGTVTVMDTSSLTIKSTITVGPDPEQMAVVGDKLYVANSGGESLTGPDSTVSVINLTTMTQISAIKVIANPVSLIADTLGHVYVISLGNYANINAGLTIINDQTDVVIAQPTVTLGYSIPMATANGYVYYPTADNNIAIFNAKTQTLVRPSFITDGTVIKIPFAITADPLSGEVFITDAIDYSSNGILYAFDKTGKKEYQLTVGINPGKIALLNK